MARPIIELVSWTGRFDALNSPRNTDTWFNELDSVDKSYKVIPPSQTGKNDALPNRFILLKKIDEEKGVVSDFGDFIYKPRIEKLITHFELDHKNLTSFISIIRHFITAVDDWLELTNGEIIIDLYRNFELGKTKHDNT